MTSTLPLILASGSPRRREFLEQTGVPFVVRPAAIDETPRPDEAPADYVRRLARTKATAVPADGAVVLAADTVVACDGHLLGKPRDDADAADMLRQLADRDHTVLTGIAVHDPARAAVDDHVEQTRVRFSPLSDHDIAWYVATGEPHDKAGAYAIQGHAALFIESITGNYSNVVGLPLPATRRLLARAGVDLAGEPGDRLRRS